MASEIAKRIAGTFIQDDTSTKPPLVAWLRGELRHGSLRKCVNAFVATQVESLDPELLQVERVALDGIHCHIPCALYDHESPGTFRADVCFRINPLTGEAIRSS